MDGFVNDTAKLLWLNIKYGKKEEKLNFLMLYSAVQHPEVMRNLLPYYEKTQEEWNKGF